MIVKSLLRKSAAMPELATAPQILTLDNPVGWVLGGSSERISPEEAMKLSAVFRAVRYYCEFVSSLPCYVYDKSKHKKVDGHYLNRVLSLRPNPMQSPADYKEMRIQDLLLRGNSYAYIVRDKHSARPVELLPLAADNVRIHKADGNIAYLYTHPDSGEIYRIDPEDISHYKWVPKNLYYGESFIAHAARTLGLAKSAAEYEVAVYENGAHPSGVLETDADLGGKSDVPDPDHEGQFLSKKENIRRAWNRVHAGSARAFRTAVLDHGLKYQPLNVTTFDAQFIAGKELTIADIARFSGVPLHALMTGKQSYASNEQNNLEFIQGPGTALLRKMEEEDSYKLLLDSDLQANLRIKNNLDGRLRGDTAARANYYNTMRNLGALSVNDIRSKEDMPDVAGGDSRLASLNYVPLDKFEEMSVDKKMERP